MAVPYSIVSIDTGMSFRFCEQKTVTSRLRGRPRSGAAVLIWSRLAILSRGVLRRRGIRFIDHFRNQAGLGSCRAGLSAFNSEIPRFLSYERGGAACFVGVFGACQHGMLSRRAIRFLYDYADHGFGKWAGTWSAWIANNSVWGGRRVGSKRYGRPTPQAGTLRRRSELRGVSMRRLRRRCKGYLSSGPHHNFAGNSGRCPEERTGLLPDPQACRDGGTQCHLRVHTMVGLVFPLHHE